jgi:hypothetical protein
MVPHAASPSPSAVLMSGMRLAQLEKHMPVQKYKLKIASLMRVLDVTDKSACSNVMN